MHERFPLPDVGWEPLAPFWAAAAEGHLDMPRCEACGRVCWYPAAQCRACGSSAVAWARLSGRGSLFSWVVVIHPFLPQFKDEVPFVSALVAIEEDPTARLVTRIVDAAPDALAFDLPVEMTIRPLSFAGVDGTVPVPMFRPAAEARGAAGGVTTP